MTYEGTTDESGGQESGSEKLDARNEGGVLDGIFDPGELVDVHFCDACLRPAAVGATGDDTTPGLSFTETIERYARFYLVTSLGFGVAAGVVTVSALQRRIPRTRVFSGALFCAGIALALAASTSTLWVATIFVFVMGVSAGPIYVLGFAILQSEVDDDLRGRVISALNTLVRLCVLVSMVLGPLLADITGRISRSLFDGEVEVGGVAMALPGVRITLWLAAVIIVGAGVVTTRTLRAGERKAAAQR